MIDDWSTYSPTDFLMFSSETYWRVVELYLSDLWYVQILVYPIVFLALWLVSRGRQTRLVYLFLAVIWLVPAYTFFLQQYATIMLAAPYFAGLFVVQSALFFLMAIINTVTPGFYWRQSAPLIVCALVVQPMLGFLVNREGASFEGVVLMPDATAVFSLGVLLLIGARFWLYVVPIVWLVISALTLYAMNDSTWIVLILTVLYCLGVQITKLSNRRKPPA